MKIPFETVFASRILTAAAIILGLVNGLAFSNDCAVKYGRNDEVIGVHATNISMREEVIEITLRKDYYEIDVTFDFFNDGPEKKVLLGFPVESRDARANIEDSVYDFKSYINGKPIQKHTINRTDSLAYGDAYMYTKWFIRDVTFPANSSTISRVTYKATYNNCQYWSAGYVYGTGRFWKGGIEKMTVIINHGDNIFIDGIYFGESIYGVNQSDRTTPRRIYSGKRVNINIEKAFTWDGNGRYKYVFENVKPETKYESFYIDLYKTVFLSDDDRYELFMLHPDDNSLPQCSTAYFGWPWDKCLMYNDSADICFYTKDQIRLFINYFFAIHGYDFKNPKYKNYFSKRNDLGDEKKTKYKVNPKFSERNFNEFEQKNIDYLLKLEKMIPPEK